jgi:hypothetical protein
MAGSGKVASNTEGVRHLGRPETSRRLQNGWLLRGSLGGAVVAAEIRQVKPQVPIVMLADHLEIPDGALKSVDAVVAMSDGPHFLLKTIQSVLLPLPVQPAERNG